jgi:hypothetical protein
LQVAARLNILLLLEAVAAAQTGLAVAVLVDI